MKKIWLTLIVIFSFSLSAGVVFAAEKKMSPAAGKPAAKETAAAKPAPEVEIPVKVPLFSPLFADFPLAMVDGKPITVKDLATALAGAHERMEEKASGKKAGKEDYSDMLNRLITARLMVAEAANMGLGDLKDVREMIDAYRHRTLRELVMDRHVKDVKADGTTAEKLYREAAREYRMMSVMVQKVADADKIEAEIKAGKDFKAIVKEFTDKGAQGGQDVKYVKQGELLPAIASVVSGMKVGEVSSRIPIESGFVFVRLDGSRLPQKVDAKVMEKAKEEALHLKKRSALTDFKKQLVRKYVRINAKLFNSLDFQAKVPGFDRMLKDGRVIATVKGEKPITVAELAGGIAGKYFHGVAEGIENKTVNEKKLLVFDELVHKRIFEKEALREGIDKTAEYRDMVKAYEGSVLFGAFVDKAVMPDVKIKPEEVKAYYREHIDDYSYPEMMRIRSIAFTGREYAENAIEKLRRGDDFDWLLANAEGRASTDAKGLLTFKGDLLITKDLPEGVRKTIAGARPGDLKLYAGPDNYYYVLSIKDVVSARPRSFAEVKTEAAKKVFAEKVKKAMDDWAQKLRKAYKVKIYAVDEDKQ